MSAWIRIMTTLTLLLLFNELRGQVPVVTGPLSGIVQDSILKQPIQAGTVSVYNDEDSKLLHYGLTTNSGAFKFENVPTNRQLKLVVSHVGYNPVTIAFVVDSNLQAKDFGIILMKARTEELDQVEIYSYKPPVQMNGDTLEFNADAFEMDKNAVVEDLMRRLPGVTMWGDGKITVNGRTVRSVLVDGKQFFGGSTTVATQNLPTGAVDKIQVYQEKSDLNPMDSLLNVNIKLKDDKKTGYFGKLGVGKSIDNHSVLNGVIAGFSSNTQISIGGLSNDVNMLPKDMTAMLENGSYKGTGLSMEFQPDFSREGLHSSTSAGLNYTHDFIPDPSYNKSNRLSGSYFVTDFNSDIIKNTKTLTAIDANTNIAQHFSTNSSSSNKSQDFRSGYDLKKSNIQLYFFPEVYKGSRRNVSNSSSVYSNNIDGQGSEQISALEELEESQKVTFKSGVKLQGFKFDINSSFSTGNRESVSESRFTSEANPSAGYSLTRKYLEKNDDAYNEIKSSYNINGLFRNGWKPLGITVDLMKELRIYKSETASDVKDRDLTGNYITNSQLSNSSTYQSVDLVPAIVLSRPFYIVFENRYKKTISLTSSIKQQFFEFHNESEQAFQNLNRKYSSFIPALSFYFSNEQFGDHSSSINIEAKKFMEYPKLYYLAPLIDNANAYFIQQGNVNLQPSSISELSLHLNYVSFHSHNFLDSYNFKIKLGRINDSFADSTSYDDSGRATNFIVNTDGKGYAMINGDFYKAIKFSGNQLQINYKGMLNFSETPKYVNGVLLKASDVYSNNSMSILYNLNDVFGVKYIQEFSFFRSSFGGQGNAFKNSVSKSILSVTSNITKKVTLASNISHSLFSSSGVNKTSFSIWNASILYRFLKNNQGEIKLSGLDLLRQNNNIINLGKENVITTGDVNVLQHYFMLSLSYYPRKFGKKDK